MLVTLLLECGGVLFGVSERVQSELFGWRVIGYTWIFETPFYVVIIQWTYLENQ